MDQSTGKRYAAKCVLPPDTLPVSVQLWIEHIEELLREVLLMRVIGYHSAVTYLIDYSVGQTPLRPIYLPLALECSLKDLLQNSSDPKLKVQNLKTFHYINVSYVISTVRSSSTIITNQQSIPEVLSENLSD